MSDSKMPRPAPAVSGAAALHPSAASKIQPQASGGKMSAQMDAVMRIMTGKEERTIADKLADSNRPTWEQYKKDNEDKLNISGLEQKKMEEYRKELDAQREKMLARGVNHSESKKEKKERKKKKRHRYSDSELSSDEFSSDDSRRRRKHKKKHRKKHDKKKRKRHHYYSSESDYSDSDSSESRRRKKHKKKRRKREKKERKKEKDDGSSDDDKYRLSSFFNKSDEGSR
uniref:Uncharacterized protein n=1 Tax=Trieres chinensis TaxID=1514140 RepID=A0A6U1Z4C4_TRICV